MPEDPPLVSCIMPTHNRRLFVPRAIEYFLRQDYPNRELIIIDDGMDPIRDLVPGEPHIRYLRQNHRISIGTARNIGCEEAEGEIIVHWDDDDWMASRRLSYQVAGLLEQRAEICGINRVIFYDPASCRQWLYIYPEKDRPWVAGNTFCYTRELWRKNPFHDINIGEDNHFIWSSRPKKIAVLWDNTFFVALVHTNNISPKRISDKRWHTYQAEAVRDIMGMDWLFYANLFYKGVGNG